MRAKMAAIMACRAAGSILPAAPEGAVGRIWAPKSESRGG